MDHHHQLPYSTRILGIRGHLSRQCSATTGHPKVSNAPPPRKGRHEGPFRRTDKGTRATESTRGRHHGGPRTTPTRGRGGTSMPVATHVHVSARRRRADAPARPRPTHRTGRAATNQGGSDTSAQRGRE